jgi:uncharacterized protein (TIGR02594 family)
MMFGPRQLRIAWGELGVREIPGAKHNPRVLEYDQAVRVHSGDDETAWCSKFMCWAHEQAGIQSTRSAAARSWLEWGKETFAIEPGCVGVFARGPNPNQGHVGFVIGTTEAGDLVVLGGNQHNEVCVEIKPMHSLLALRRPVAT